MEKNNQAIELLKSRLLELDNDIKNKKEVIEKQYADALKNAAKNKFAALSELDDQENEKMNIVSALKVLGEKMILSNNLQVPEKYSEELPFVKKAIYALFQIKFGDFEAIKEKLLELEPNINQKSLQDLNQTLSGLYTKGLIDAVRNGRRYTYSIH